MDKGEKRRHSKLSIRKRIFIIMFIVSIVPVVLFTYFAVNNLYVSLHDQIIQSGKTSIDHIRDRLEIMVKNYSDRFYELEVDKEFKDDIYSWCYDDAGLDHTKQWRIISILNSWMSVDWRINSIDINNLHNGQVLQVKRTGAKLLDSGKGLGVWGGRISDLQTNTVFIRNGDEMLIKHQMNRFETGNALVVIVIHTRYSAIDSMLEDMIADEKESILLFNDEDDLIASIQGVDEDIKSLKASISLDELKSRNVESEPYQAGGRYLFAKSISKNKLYIVRAVPEEIIKQATANTLRVGVLIGVVSLIVSLIISSVMSKVISNPIVELAGTMKTLSVNNFSADTDINRNDEIGLLQSSFHSMIARNQELINKEYKSKLEKHQAQINALQAQINPHFLYNTLQVIGGMTLDDRTSEIYDMTVALSDIMRYSLSVSCEMVKLSEELKYLESYLLIQKERFDNDIKMELDIPDTLMDYLIPKLILQPIIENSFEHGLKNKMGIWEIGITARFLDNEVLAINVKDNGIGIKNDRLTQIRSSLKDLDSVFNSKNHIGLRNVNARIKLLFGNEYGIKIDSEENKGTNIVISTKAVLE